MPDTEATIITPRLHLTALDIENDSHIAYRVQLANSPAIRAQAVQLGHPSPPLTPEAARAHLESVYQRADRNGSGLYLVSLQKSNPNIDDESDEMEYIGIVSMMLKRYPDMQCPVIPDIGFVFHEDYRGKGYAAEACEGVMKYFRESRGIERIAGFTHPENPNSKKLFTRLGFVERGLVDVSGILPPDGSARNASVWLYNVDLDVELEELGIGPGKGGTQG
ncbi:hypothetical protein E8E13_007410 [Curvularia kusanoi]|uniref:N-acetyltransferase domain-containing protein n=1 Tax=Curvularia kusanoi TaxID=90978 RepID=A0A9P4WBI1_CURKU|nr:hypothetical protein E8E13_007410 [Curvularia kusanoi]